MMRKNIIELQHNETDKQENVRPQPDTCRYITSAALQALAKAQGRVEMLETDFVDNRIVTL